VVKISVLNIAIYILFRFGFTNIHIKYVSTKKYYTDHLIKIIGLDNLHEYLKFSYPRMQAPSFICENESRQGLTLHYRSKRRGFVYYTMGQIKEVARHFYHKVNNTNQ